MSDTIALTVPSGDDYRGVARLVVGGLAARLDFSYEHLEDLQLALDSLLSNESYAAGGEVSVELTVDDGAVEMRVGPLGPALQADFEREVEESEGIGLGRLLRTVAEGVEIEERDGGAWVRLEKRVPGGGARAAT